MNTAKQYGVDLDEYMKLDAKGRVLVAVRHSKGQRGADLLRGLDTLYSLKTLDSAKRYGVSPDWWEQAPESTKRTLASRYYRGKRGEALIKGIYAA